MTQETPTEQDFKPFPIDDPEFEDFILNLDFNQYEKLETPQDFTTSEPTTSVSGNTPLTPDTTPQPIKPKSVSISHKQAKQNKYSTTLRQTIEKQKQNEKATLYYTRTKNPRFQLNLIYALKESFNQWNIIFWDPKRQEFTLENPHLKFQRLTVPLRSISAII